MTVRKTVRLFIAAAALSVFVSGCGDKAGSSSQGSIQENDSGKDADGKKENAGMAEPDGAAENFVEDKNQKVTSVGKEIADMLGENRKKTEDAVSGVSSDIEVKEDNGGFLITTTTQAQRDEIVGILSGFVHDAVSDIQKDGSGIKFNYDISGSYISVYCKKEDAEKVQNAVNAVMGYMALGKRMQDNTIEWSIAVTINDSGSGKIVEKAAVSGESPSFTLSQGAWDTVRE